MNLPQPNAPRCPRCGTPARVAILQKARVRCELAADGTVGRVLSTTKEPSDPAAFECGGRHTWNTLAGDAAMEHDELVGRLEADRNEAVAAYEDAVAAHDRDIERLKPETRARVLDGTARFITAPLMKEIVVWATNAAREEVLTATSQGRPVDSEGGMGLWQSFQATFPRERFSPHNYDLAVALYGQVYSAAVVSGVKLLAGEWE